MTLDEAVQDIEIAFRQVEFAIKLLSHCELGKIDAAEFDTDHVVLLKKGNLGFPTGHFSDPNNIISAAMVTASLAFGATALALDQAYEVAGVPKDILSDDNGIRLRTLVYMVRCAHAHGIADPRWEVQGKYQSPVSLDLRGERISVNLAELNGVTFDFEHLGGHQNWFLIRDAAVEALRKLRD